MHDIKGDNLQINSIESKEEVKIIVVNPLTYTAGFTPTEFDLVQKWYVDLTLIKGKWSALFAANDFYLEDFIVLHNNALYISLEGETGAGNLAEPGTDETKWQIVGGSPASVPIPNSTTTYLTQSDLTTAYADAWNGQEVHCTSISDGPLIYKKVNGVWYTISLGQLA